MEHLPVEVIGNILSFVRSARDVVIASATCEKWREPWRNHLHALSFNSNDWPIYRVEPSYQTFPCLKSLSLSYVSISALDLSLLMTECPKLETLTIVNPEIAMSDSQASMELSSSSVKNFYVESFGLDKFILEADSLENLHLKDCTFDVFELIGKGNLKIVKIDYVCVIHLDIGENTEDLEIVDVCNLTIMWPKFYHLISKASDLCKLRLWGVIFDDEDEVVDLETISVCFPRLTQLSLSYDLRDGRTSLWFAAFVSFGECGCVGTWMDCYQRAPPRLGCWNVGKMSQFEKTGYSWGCFRGQNP